MGHHASYPPRCSKCKKFMPHARSQVVREYTGAQMNFECDDIEVGICAICEANHLALLDSDPPNQTTKGK